jgi:hypothetical protein
MSTRVVFARRGGDAKSVGNAAMTRIAAPRLSRDLPLNSHAITAEQTPI